MPVPKKCPVCGSEAIHFHREGKYDGEEVWLCDNCGHRWDIMPY